MSINTSKNAQTAVQAPVYANTTSGEVATPSQLLNPAKAPAVPEVSKATGAAPPSAAPTGTQAKAAKPDATKPQRPFEVIKGADGSKKLAFITRDKLTGSAQANLDYMMGLAKLSAAGLNDNFLDGVSHGSQINYIYDHKLHKLLRSEKDPTKKMTQEELSLKLFGVSDRSVLSLRNSARACDRLGDQLENFPTSHAQMGAVLKVKDEFQGRTWNELYKGLKRAPTAKEIMDYAGGADLLIAPKLGGSGAEKNVPTAAVPKHFEITCRAIIDELRQLAIIQCNDRNWKRVAQLAKSLEDGLSPIANVKVVMAVAPGKVTKCAVATPVVAAKAPAAARSVKNEHSPGAQKILGTFIKTFNKEHAKGLR